MDNQTIFPISFLVLENILESRHLDTTQKWREFPWLNKDKFSTFQQTGGSEFKIKLI